MSEIDPVAFARLTPLRREIVLRVLAGETYRQIADSRGVDPGAIRESFRYAQAALGDAIEYHRPGGGRPVGFRVPEKTRRRMAKAQRNRRVDEKMGIAGELQHCPRCDLRGDHVCRGPLGYPSSGTTNLGEAAQPWKWGKHNERNRDA